MPGRILRKYPGFSLAIILTAALGIGANVTIFSVLHAVLLEPLPYKDPDRLGRLEEEKPGNGKVVLLSDALWQRQFGGDRTIVDQTIQLDGESYTVVGVMPPGFQFTVARELWVPFVIDPSQALRGE